MLKGCNRVERNGYAAILLFAFMLGALLGMLYLPQLNDLSVKHENLGLEIFALLNAASGIFASSVLGCVFLPVMCFLSGSVAALEIDMIAKVLAQGGNPEGHSVLLLITIVPLHFIICGIGMKKSAEIRRAVKVQKYSGRDIFVLYMIMIVGLLPLSAVLRYIIYK